MLIKLLIENVRLLFYGNIQKQQSLSITNSFLAQYAVICAMITLLAATFNPSEIPGWESYFSKSAEDYQDSILGLKYLGITVKDWIWSLGIYLLFWKIGSKVEVLMYYTAFMLFASLTPLMMFLTGYLESKAIALTLVLLVSIYPLIRVYTFTKRIRQKK